MCLVLFEELNWIPYAFPITWQHCYHVFQGHIGLTLKYGGDFPDLFIRLENNLLMQSERRTSFAQSSSRAAHFSRMYCLYGVISCSDTVDRHIYAGLHLSGCLKSFDKSHCSSQYRHCVKKSNDVWERHIVLAGCVFPTPWSLAHQEVLDDDVYRKHSYCGNVLWDVHCLWVFAPVPRVDHPYKPCWRRW